MQGNSKMMSLLMIKRANELGFKIKDFMNHLIPRFNKGTLYSYLDLVRSTTSEDMLVLYNPSLDYVDTVLIQIKGRKVDKMRMYIWLPETQTFKRVSPFQDEPSGAYFEKLCSNNKEAERICEIYLHHLISPLEYTLVKIVTHTLVH